VRSSGKDQTKAGPPSDLRAMTARRRPPGGRTRANAEVAELEQRIKDLEERIKSLESRLEDVARTGNYMETRRVGEEHATLEQTLRELYEEWAARGE
jgi:predicted  nucleic acid-binding Zn-ribbon protein